MKPEEFTKCVLEIIKSNPDGIVEFIKNEDWDELQDEIFYLTCSAIEG